MTSRAGLALGAVVGRLVLGLVLPAVFAGVVGSAALAQAEPTAAASDGALQERFAGWVSGAAIVVDGLDGLGERLSQQAGDVGIGRMVGFMLGAVLLGFIAERLVWRITRPLRLRIVEAPRTSALDRSVLIVARLLVAVLSAALFAGGMIGAYLAIDWPPDLAPIALAYIGVWIAGRGTAVFARLVLAPWVAQLRLVPMGRRSAFAAYWATVAAAVIAATGFLATSCLGEMGLDRLLPRLIGDAVILLFAALWMIWVWQWHRIGRLDPETAVRAGLTADLERWVVTIAAVIVVLCVFADLMGLALTVALLALAPMVVRVVRAVTQAVVDGRTGTAETVSGLRASESAAIAERAVEAILGIGAIALLANSWGVSLPDLLAGESAVGRVVRVAIEVAIAFAIADLLWRSARRWIDRRIVAAGPSEEEGALVEAPTRLATLLPLLRKTFGSVLIVILALITLSAVGVEIGPLLAGAGIVGIAIGFGAQALVRDVVSGIFFLIDDAFRVGEYVEIGNTRGTVEAISIRSMRLRHHRGALHTVPFGEIRTLTNHSREWAIVKIEFPFPVDTDPQRVKKIVKTVGAEIAADPDLEPNLLEPPKSQGVSRVENYAIVIRVKFMARPGEQFVIRREVYHRLLKAFEAAGLSLASRDVVVRAQPDAEGTALPAVVVASEPAPDRMNPG